MVMSSFHPYLTIGYEETQESFEIRNVGDTLKTILIIIGIALVVLLALMGYACIIVGSDAERESEAYIEQKRKREERQKELTGE